MVGGRKQFTKARVRVTLMVHSGQGTLSRGTAGKFPEQKHAFRVRNWGFPESLRMWKESRGSKCNYLKNVFFQTS